MKKRGVFVSVFIVAFIFFEIMAVFAATPDLYVTFYSSSSQADSVLGLYKVPSCSVGSINHPECYESEDHDTFLYHAATSWFIKVPYLLSKS